MRRRLSLQSKIIFLFAAVTTIMISSIVLFDSYSVRKAVEETYVHQLLGITTAINGRYEESHSIDDVQQIFDYIQSRDPNVMLLSLHGSRGADQYQILASTNRKLIGMLSPSYSFPSLILNKTFVSHMYSDQDQVPKVRLMTPLKEDGKTIGAIELLLNSSDENVLIWGRVKDTIIVGLSIEIVMLGLLWLIIRKLLVYPLMALREAAVSLQQGEKYQAMKLSASQEINEVVAAFNDMVYNLEDRYRKSITDALTGLYNSAYFKHELDKSMQQAREFGHSLAVLFCDVDNFKMINDNEGHIYGDEVLKEIADLLQKNVRPTDIVCRYGGEEFVIIMPHANRATAMSIAEQIRQMVAIHCSHSMLYPITVSIGVALFPEDADEEALVHLADQAMYTAKSLGKNRVISVIELSTYQEQDYKRRTQDSRWFFNTIVSLARAVEVKDPYTHSHSEMVSRYAAAIASTMGLPDEEVKRISIAGLLHDVGKIGTPDSILNKEGRLTPEEYEIMKDHPVLGYNILSSVEELRDIVPYVLYHHERPDGKGYPAQLTKDQIPLGARIVAVADAYHSMVSSRPYRKDPLTREQASEQLKQGSGTQFDRDVVEIFLEVILELSDE